MPVHVCVDARLIFQGGIGTFLRSTLAAFQQLSFVELTLLCREEDQEELKAYDARCIPMKSSIYTLKEQYEYFRKTPTCDLFWHPHFNVPLLPIRARKKITVIHDVYHLAHASSLTLRQKLYAYLFYNRAFCASDLLVTISEFSKKEILKFARFSPKKIAVVSPPFTFTPSPLPQVKKKYLLAVGNLKPHKNLVRLVAAYAQLQPEAELYIVGKKEGLITLDAPLFERVKNDPFLKTHVHFTGQVEEHGLKELYAHAFLFLFLSTYEGFGYPPLEAMSHECPVVASRVAAIPEVCQDAVEYVNPYSVDSIAKGIKRLLLDKKRREELIQKGKELVEAKKKEAHKLVEFLHACCSCT